MNANGTARAKDTIKVTAVNTTEQAESTKPSPIALTKSLNEGAGWAGTNSKIGGRQSLKSGASCASVGPVPITRSSLAAMLLASKRVASKSGPHLGKSPFAGNH